jgi:transcription termination factor Rho
MPHHRTASRRPGRPHPNGTAAPRPHQNGTTPPPRPQPGRPVDPDKLVPSHGVLEVYPKGFGFLRDASRNYAVGPNDAYVSPQLIDKHQLAEGMTLVGKAEPIRPGTGPRLAEVETIDGTPAGSFVRRNFDELTAVDPSAPLRLETGPEPLTTRVMDLLAPIGKGQRGLIVAPPRTGKTVLLQHLAAAVAANHPEMYLMMLLIDERPEEVTDMKRTVKGEVIASCNDRDSGSHLRTAEFAVNRAKRLAEQGREVFILLDSLTRMARAYNKAANTGRTMSGGLDSRALDIPKRLFGSARAFEEGGSLTVIGTCLVETGSRMDDVIFQEFKGTGNMELVLDRKLADRRIFPAMDIAQSGTRKEELLLPPDVLQKTYLLRRTLMQMGPTEAMEALIKQLGKSPSNAAFLERMALAGK